MASEIEISINNVDPEEVESRLMSLGAKHVGSYDYKIANFQLGGSGDVKNADHHSWLRIRSDGKITTLAFKEQQGANAEERHECEVNVSDFVDTVRIIRKALPDAQYDYIEKHREEYLIEGEEIEAVIDKWPLLSWYKMELEGKSRDALLRFYARMGLKSGQLGKNLAISNAEFYKMLNIDYQKTMEAYKKKLDSMLEEPHS